MATEENKHYDVWLEWTITHQCNLRCAYCWFNKKSQPQINKKGALRSFTYRIKKPFSLAAGKTKRLLQIGIFSAIRILSLKLHHMAIDIKSLKNTLDRTDLIFRINLTGGEPFLVPNIIEACTEITKKHFVSLTTNLTSAKIKDFAEKIDPKRVAKIHASCHLKELERLNLTDRFIDNFKLCKEKGFNIYATVRAWPPLLSEAEKYKQFFREKGIELIFAQFCGNYAGKRYPEEYTAEEKMIFELDGAEDTKMFHSKGKICNAGYNVAVVSSYGDAWPCYQVKEKLGNIFHKIKFKKDLIKCPCELCGCPLNCYDKYLFKKAIAECGNKTE